MPKITVLCATCRIGGIDVLFQTLIGQRFRDFEFILVDRYWRERREEVGELFDKADFPITHLPPRKLLSYLDTGVATNTGIALARGKLVCFLADYTYAYPEWLDDHWRVYQEFKGDATFVGYRDRIAPPPLKEKLDIESCKISCFREPFHPERLDELEILYSERKPLSPLEHITGPYSEIPWHGFMIYCNESLPKDILDRVGGLDEEYDGGLGWQDADLGYRAMKAGHRFVFDSRAKLTKRIDTRTFLPPGLVIAGKSNEELFRRKCTE